MTIALGILTGDGVVVAADTLETRGAGFPKTNIPKILTGGTTGKSGCGCYAVTGAGDSSYLNGIKQEIADLFLNHSRAGTINSAFEPELKKLVRRFHVHHVIPFAKYPDYERPTIDLVVASSHSHSHRLWVTNRTDTSTAFPYATVGCGSGYAKAMLDRLSLPWTDIRLVKVVAAYVIFSTKNNVEGCGGNTHVATVSGDIASYLPRDVINALGDTKNRPMRDVPKPANRNGRTLTTAGTYSSPSEQCLERRETTTSPRARPAWMAIAAHPTRDRRTTRNG